LSSGDGQALAALCGFVRHATGADLVLAVELQADGRASWTTSSPALINGSFNLARSGVLEHGWEAVAVEARGFRLPTVVIHALGGPAAALLFVPAPTEHGPRSGLFLLWRHAAPTAASTAALPLLADSVAQLLSARRQSARGVEVHNQFTDLVESVPTGIVLIDGDGVSTTVNERAAALLGLAAGNHRAAALGEAMRALRQRCDNHAELEQAYASQVGNLDFAATLHWTLGEWTYEVDTHPVRGDGEHGRIWIFTDVTADLLMAAELRRLASSDPLTGVPNRRRFEESSAQIIAAKEAGGRCVAVLMLDVDHFKKINDTHGHPVGDEVLKVVARRCREALREHDLFARFGGEEFIALLPSTSAAEAPLAAERLRSVIAAAPVHVDGVQVPVTISVGGAVGETLPGADKALLEALIGQADEALYAAKAGGRNRVMMAGLSA